MDLDEMKSAWSEMSLQLEQQKKLTNDIILKMTQEKSTSRLNRIIRMEGFGVVITVIALAYIGLNFGKLDNWLEVTGGIGTLLILLVSIGFGLKLIGQANKIDLRKNSFKDTLNYFNDFRKSLGFYKRFSIIINAISPLFIFPVAFALFTEKDLLADPSIAIYGLIGAAVFIPLMLILIIRFYKSNVSTVKQAFNEYEKHE